MKTLLTILVILSLSALALADSKVMTCFGKVEADGRYVWLQAKFNGSNNLVNLAVNDGSSEHGPLSGFTFGSATGIEVEPREFSNGALSYTGILEDYSGCGMDYHKSFARLILPEGLKGETAKVLTWNEGSFNEADSFDFFQCEIF